MNVSFLFHFNNLQVLLAYDFNAKFSQLIRQVEKSPGF